MAAQIQVSPERLREEQQKNNVMAHELKGMVQALNRASLGTSWVGDSHDRFLKVIHHLIPASDEIATVLEEMGALLAEAATGYEETDHVVTKKIKELQ
jgi:WXG100 family type VII secretion target